MSVGASRPRVGVIACVALPVLGLLFGIARSELHFARSQDWVLAVQGYDPRDLLRGRYIDYRLDLKEAGGLDCRNEDPDCCLCLTRVSGQELPQVARRSCGTSALSCDGLLRTDSLSTLQRYYVPEAQAAAAERRLQDAAGRDSARLVIAIDPGGKPQVKRMLVDGTPLVR